MHKPLRVSARARPLLSSTLAALACTYLQFETSFNEKLLKHGGFCRADLTCVCTSSFQTEAQTCFQDECTTTAQAQQALQALQNQCAAGTLSIVSCVYCGLILRISSVVVVVIIIVVIIEFIMYVTYLYLAVGSHPLIFLISSIDHDQKFHDYVCNDNRYI